MEEGGKEGGANRMLLRQIVFTRTFIFDLSFSKKSAQEMGGEDFLESRVGQNLCRSNLEHCRLRRNESEVKEI